MSPFALENIKELHLELTTKCNAACPQCARTDPTSNYTTDYELNLTRVKSLFSIEFVKGLSKVLACGNFGDPAANPQCLDIMRWFKEINPNITLGINTNGGLRNTKFWSTLGTIFSGPLDYVVFSIDGLENTNHIYRINVQWDKVMRNTQAFISAGGSAHWDMLVFDHNEHQFEECKQLAKNMGFTRFRSKVSSRFSTKPIEFLKPPASFATIISNGPVSAKQ